MRPWSKTKAASPPLLPAEFTVRPEWIWREAAEVVAVEAELREAEARLADCLGQFNEHRERERLLGTPELISLLDRGDAASVAIQARDARDKAEGAAAEVKRLRADVEGLRSRIPLLKAEAKARVQPLIEAEGRRLAELAADHLVTVAQLGEAMARLFEVNADVRQPTLPATWHEDLNLRYSQSLLCQWLNELRALGCDVEIVER